MLSAGTSVFSSEFCKCFFEDPVYLKTHGHDLKLISRKSYRVVGEINLMLSLDPGFKSNHWFSFIRKERSSCSQKNLLEKMHNVLQKRSF
jgi:hypothetical protein